MKRVAVAVAVLLIGIITSLAMADDMAGSPTHKNIGVGFHNVEAPLGIRWWLKDQKIGIDLGLGYSSTPGDLDPDESVTGLAFEVGVPFVIHSWDRVHVLLRPGLLYQSQEEQILPVRRRHDYAEPTRTYGRLKWKRVPVDNAVSLAANGIAWVNQIRCHWRGFAPVVGTPARQQLHDTSHSTAHFLGVLAFVRSHLRGLDLAVGPRFLAGNAVCRRQRTESRGYRARTRMSGDGSMAVKFQTTTRCSSATHRDRGDQARLRKLARKKYLISRHADARKPEEFQASTSERSAQRSGEAREVRRARSGLKMAWTTPLLALGRRRRTCWEELGGFSDRPIFARPEHARDARRGGMRMEFPARTSKRAVDHVESRWGASVTRPGLARS